MVLWFLKIQECIVFILRGLFSNFDLLVLVVSVVLVTTPPLSEQPPSITPRDGARRSECGVSIKIVFFRASILESLYSRSSHVTTALWLRRQTID